VLVPCNLSHVANVNDTSESQVNRASVFQSILVRSTFENFSKLILHAAGTLSSILQSLKHNHAFVRNARCIARAIHR